MNRSQRRQAAKEFQAQLASGAVDLSQEFSKPKAITLAYAAGEFVRAAFLRSLMAVGARSSEFGFMVRPRDVEYDIERPKALNMLLRSFLQGEDEYLLFADTNVAFAPQDVAMLIAADTPIAGALYFSAATGAESWPVAWVEAATEGLDEVPEVPVHVPVSLPAPPEDFDETNQEQLESWMATLAAPIPVAGVGFGLCLISRSTVEAVAEMWEYPFEVLEDRREDLNFCLRAGELGLQTVVVPAARVGNMKQAML